MQTLYENYKATWKSHLPNDPQERHDSMECGCFSPYSTYENGEKKSVVTNKPENAILYKEVKFFVDDEEIFSMQRNTYYAQPHNFVVKFFTWRDTVYFAFNEVYGEISVYSIVDRQPVLYLNFITNCFNETIKFVNNGLDFVILHWVWQPVYFWSFYNLDKFMTENVNHREEKNAGELNEDAIKQLPRIYKRTSPYVGRNLYTAPEYNDGMWRFNIIENADYFTYTFLRFQWAEDDYDLFCLKKLEAELGFELEDGIVSISYEVFKKIKLNGFHFPL
jgi:hypothetical protein